MKGKRIQKEVLPHSRGEKNTLMFYVLRQTHHSFVWRRHCINTPEQFYKVVSRINNAQRRRQQHRDTVINIHNNASALEDPPKAIRHLTTE